MYPQKVTLAKGKIRYYIRYRDEQGKVRCLPVSEYRHFSTFEECQDWINKNRHKYTHIPKNAKIVEEIQAKKLFPSQQKMIDIFEKQQKIDAPNSWESSMYYLDRFVLVFFNLKMGLKDINQWIHHYEDFKRYLDEEAVARSNGKPIAYSTKNHCIRTLNKFITVMSKNGYFHLANPPKCSPFPKRLLNVRGYSAVIKPEEYELLKERLDHGRDFFVILYHTAMRFNELYSLPICDIYFEDEIPKHLEEKFERYKDKKEYKRIYGYISLRNQITGKVRTRLKKKGKEGHIERKPLKSCYDDEPKNRRIIPIFDKECWEIILENYHRSVDEYDEVKYGSERAQDYFLLDVEANKLRREFQKICKELGLKNKSFHSCRHTRTTLWAGKFDQALVRAFTGHRSEAYEAYVHIYEMLQEEIHQKRQWKPRRKKNLKAVS